MTRDIVLRIVLALMAIGTAVVGAWAEFAPRSFYDSFPGSGRHWVAADGPYNQHLVRDFGAMNLALAVLAVFAIVQGSLLLVRATAVTYLVFDGLHLVYHLRHLDLYSGSDKAANVVTLALAVALPVAALVLSGRTSRTPSGGP